MANTYNNTYKILRNVYLSGSTSGTSLATISSTYDLFRAVYNVTENALNVRVTGDASFNKVEVTDQDTGAFILKDVADGTRYEVYISGGTLTLNSI